MQKLRDHTVQSSSSASSVSGGSSTSVSSAGSDSAGSFDGRLFSASVLDDCDDVALRGLAAAFVPDFDLLIRPVKNSFKTAFSSLLSRLPVGLVGLTTDVSLAGDDVDALEARKFGGRAGGS